MFLHLRQVSQQRPAGVCAEIHGQRLRAAIGRPRLHRLHGIHTIKAPKDTNSSVAVGNVQNTCGGCHASVKLSNEFGVPGAGSRPTWASYHGMAEKVGSKTVANCASCHGVHNILPSSDPHSTINHANLAKTCGHAIPAPTTSFITSKVHLDGTAKADFGSKVIGFISRFYVWMIVGVIGAWYCTT